MESKSRFTLTHSWPTINWIAAHTAHISRPGSGPQLRQQLHGAIYRPDSFVLMLRYCANLKAIRYESTSLNRIVADISPSLIAALDNVHIQISLLSDEVSRSVDIGIEERSQLKEDIGLVRVLIIAHRGYFTNNHIIIHLILNL